MDQGVSNLVAKSSVVSICSVAGGVGGGGVPPGGGVVEDPPPQFVITATIEISTIESSNREGVIHIL